MGISKGVGLDENSADAVDFDPSTTDLTATDVQGAIEELVATVGVSASPGFGFGRSGNSTSGTYLLTAGSVPSNRAGITVALLNPEITNVYVANETVSTFDVSIYEHEGDEINLTLLDTVSITSSRSATFSVSIAVTSGKQIAVRVMNGSAKNINVGLQLKGNL